LVCSENVLKLRIHEKFSVPAQGPRGSWVNVVIWVIWIEWFTVGSLDNRSLPESICHFNIGYTKQW